MAAGGAALVVSPVVEGDATAGGAEAEEHLSPAEGVEGAVRRQKLPPLAAEPHYWELLAPCPERPSDDDVVL